MEQLVNQHTELPTVAIERLSQIIAEWTLLADLSFSDLLLWVPKWHDAGYVCVAQIRPVTAPTTIDSDLVGSFQAERRLNAVDRAFNQQQIIELDNLMAIPILHDGECLAVLERHRGERQQGELTNAYLAAANRFFQMLVVGQFPPTTDTSTTTSLPRVGDGVILLDATGVVQYASPNATSAFRRLGLATDLSNTELSVTAASLLRKAGVIDEAIYLITKGTTAGAAELENKSATITLRCYPFILNAKSDGALILIRDVTELRRRERALLTKDAALREAHHRVKNNLQTVAALLRMQGRRSNQEAKRALAEAERRIEVIALVHETLTLAPAAIVDFNEIADRLISLTKQLSPAAIAINRIGSFGSYAADVAVPLAASLSELLQNAVEHGDPTAPIELQIDSATPISFKVINQAKTRGAHAEGLGLSIVRSLIEGELLGEVQTYHSAGQFEVSVLVNK